MLFSLECALIASYHHLRQGYRARHSLSISKSSAIDCSSLVNAIGDLCMIVCGKRITLVESVESDLSSLRNFSKHLKANRRRQKAVGGVSSTLLSLYRHQSARKYVVAVRFSAQPEAFWRTADCRWLGKLAQSCIQRDSQTAHLRFRYRIQF